MRVTVAIPKAIRERLGVGPGSEVDIVPTEDAVRLVAVKEKLGDESSRSFRETLRGMAGTLKSLRHDNRQIHRLDTSPVKT
jgi:AbrB family looped-hinge helix DNA binding protein